MPRARCSVLFYGVGDEDEELMKVVLVVKDAARDVLIIHHGW